MDRISLPLTLVFALIAVAIPSGAAGASTAAQGQQTKRVWTNEDLDELRARGLISIFGTVPETAPAAPPQPTRYASRLQDPVWYAEQAAELQAQLNGRMMAVVQAQQALMQARGLRQTTGGINLAEGNAGVTPEEGIAILAARVAEIQSRFEELADLARRNYIPPGVLRPPAV
jgi:hypothetical protein